MVLNIKEFKKLKSELKALMGNNFVDPLDWHLSYGIDFSTLEKKKMANFPWSLEFLKSDCPFEKGKKIYETHFLFWGHPVTIPWLVDRFPDYNERKFMLVLGMENELYNQKVLDSSWYLMPIRFNVLVEDRFISFPDHIKMIPDAYELASAVEEATKQIFIKRWTGHFAKDLFLFPTESVEMIRNPKYKKGSTLQTYVLGKKYFDTARILFARCSDKLNSERHIIISTLDKNGLSIVSMADDKSQLSLALSLKRKI